MVLITTKRGRAGEAKFSYDGMMAVSRQTKRLDMLNLRGFGGYYNDFVASGFGGVKEDPYYSDVSLLGVGTNWAGCHFSNSFSTTTSSVGTRWYGENPVLCIGRLYGSGRYYHRF